MKADAVQSLPLPREATLKRIGTIVLLVLLGVAVFYLGERKNFGTQQYVQLALDGIRGGTIYALIALGFVAVFKVTDIINFAQGAFVTLGAMIAVTIYGASLPVSGGWKMVVACVGAVLATTLVGILMERLTIYPARHTSQLTQIIITIGAYIVIQGLALLVWGTTPYTLPAFTTLEIVDKTFRVGGVIVKAQSFWIWGVTAVVLAVLAYFFERTLWGKGLRACAVNRQAARLMGISPSRMSLLAFAMAAALGAIGGAVLAPVTRPIYDMGLTLGLKGFVAATMGGLVSLPAAVVGGILLGAIENIAAGVTDAGFKDIFAFIILILILLFRPYGLFAGEGEEREEV